MPSPRPLALGCIYHVYNRGTNGETLFRTERNCRYFLERYTHYIEPVAITYAYCLMKNHFHLAIRTRTEEEQVAYHTAAGNETPFRLLSPSRRFSHLFNAYARAYNRDIGRTGSLFEHPFRRKLVQDERYLWHLIVYIHRNPEHHGFVKDFREWPFSSYRTHLSDKPTRLVRDWVLAGIGGRHAFAAAHDAGSSDQIQAWMIEAEDVEDTDF
jgi:putative transposase